MHKRVALHLIALLEVSADLHDENIAPTFLEMGGLAVNDRVCLQLPKFLRVIEIPIFAEDVATNSAKISIPYSKPP